MRPDPEPAPPARRPRHGRALVLAIGVLGLVVLGRTLAGDAPAQEGLAVLSDGETRPSPTTGPPTTTAVALDPLTVTVTAVEVRSPGGAVTTLPEPVETGVVDTVANYLTAATVQPFVPSATSVTLASLFTEATRPRLDGPDRRALLDEGLGRATGGVSFRQATVSLSALADPDGTVRLVTVTLDARAVVHTADGPLAIIRTGDLVLVPEGDVWKIDAFRLSARRELGADAAAEAGL